MHIIKKFHLGIALAALLFSCTSPHKEAGQEKEIRVISHTSRSAESVYLTKNYSGIPAIVWTEQDTTKKGEKYFYFSLLDSLTNDFEGKIQIPIEQHALLHIEGMPKIAFKKSGEILAIFEVKVESESNPFAGEIHYTVSKDKGISWSKPQRVHSSQTLHQGRGFFDMITLADGEIGVSWLGESNRDGGRPVLFAKTNGANAFVDEMVVDSLACECCRTAIYADKRGMISIVYRDIIKGSIRDISLSLSKDSGKTFSPPICFSGDNWNLDGCPHNGPDVVSDEKNLYAVWFSGGNDRGLYMAQVDKQTLKADKKLISKNGSNILVVDKEGKAIIVYNENYSKNKKKYSKISVVTYPDTGIVEVSEEGQQAHSPTIIVGSDNQMIISWLERNKELDVVKYRVINKSLL